MRLIYAVSLCCALILGGVLFHHHQGDQQIRQFCRDLPLKLSQAEVRSLAHSAGLTSLQLPNSEMKVNKPALWGLIERGIACRIAFGRELTVEYRMIEGE